MKQLSLVHLHIDTNIKNFIHENHFESKDLASINEKSSFALQKAFLLKGWTEWKCGEIESAKLSINDSIRLSQMFQDQGTIDESLMVLSLIDFSQNTKSIYMEQLLGDLTEIKDNEVLITILILKILQDLSIQQTESLNYSFNLTEVANRALKQKIQSINFCSQNTKQNFDEALSQRATLLFEISKENLSPFGYMLDWKDLQVPSMNFYLSKNIILETILRVDL